MRIVIIAKQTYPFQGPRAFRVAELSEQLSKMGHEVHVYAFLGDYDYSDYMAKTGIHLHNIKMRFVFEASSGLLRYNLFDKIMVHLFSKWLCYPDIEFAFRIGAIMKRERNCDLLITVAFPHPIHWGAAFAKRRFKSGFPKCWISDCGDPFCLNPFFSVPKYFRVLEKQWCRLTDFITVPTKESIGGYFSEFHHKIRVIPQGFDLTKTKTQEYHPNKPTTFAFAGYIYEGKRDPLSFIEYLSNSSDDFRFILYTREPVPVKYKALLKNKIINIVGLTREQCIFELSKADFLINILNDHSIQTPSKLIDYALSKRPILDIGMNFTQKLEFEAFMRGVYSSAHRVDNIDDYNIISVAEKFVNLYHEKMVATAALG